MINISKAAHRHRCIWGLLICASSHTYAQSVIIATAQFNNARTGANQSEQLLKPSNLASFGKRHTLAVDGQVFAEPLYIPGMKIGGNRVNVLFVATMNNSIYAFNADTGSAIFRRNLGTPVPLGWAGTCPYGGTGMNQLGILSTPVIDVRSDTLYAVSATPSGGTQGSGTFVHRLFAINIRNGSVRDSVVISANVRGTGYDAIGSRIYMNPTRYIQRTALLLDNGTVYAGFGSCGPDPDPYHGWLVGYRTKELRQRAVFNTSPNGSRNAIWQSGRGPASDDSGNIYVMTANGSNGNMNFSNSVLKISPSGALYDWFTPANYAMLDSLDLDLSSSGPVFMSDSNQVVGGGKEGVMYVLNANSLGQSGPPVQQFQATKACGQPIQYVGFNCSVIFSTAYWAAGQMLYVWGLNDTLRAYPVQGGRISTTPASQSSITAGYPGGHIAVSAQGNTAGIVWAVTPDHVVRAFDARNVATELWNSNMNAADNLPAFAKFVAPVIADGKVFVATWANAVVVYGLK